jgi:hypothetical protein
LKTLIVGALVGATWAGIVAIVAYPLLGNHLAGLCVAVFAALGFLVGGVLAWPFREKDHEVTREGSS